MALVEGFTYDHERIERWATVHWVSSDELAVRMVAQQRVDALLGEEASILQMARTVGTDRLRYQADAPISETGVYLRYAKDLDPAIQASLNDWLVRYRERQARAARRLPNPQ